jgi:hypothetical protein
MTTDIAALIAEARKASRAVYLATDKTVADDLARILEGLADALEAAHAEPKADRKPADSSNGEES